MQNMRFGDFWNGREIALLFTWSSTLLSALKFIIDDVRAFKIGISDWSRNCLTEPPVYLGKLRSGTGKTDYRKMSLWAG